MPYRRTANVERKLAARRNAILAAARDLAAENGIAAVQIAPVAMRAQIAAGTVYRYFPSKTELVAALVGMFSEAEIVAIKRASDAAPGPLSALAAAIVTFGTRALHGRRLAFAMLSEPNGPEADDARIAFRKRLAACFESRIAAAVAAGHLPDQDCATAAAALVGGLIEGLIGPLAKDTAKDAISTRTIVQSLSLFALRALGVVDARARCVVVQTPVPFPAR